MGIFNKIKGLFNKKEDNTDLNDLEKKKNLLSKKDKKDNSKSDIESISETEINLKSKSDCESESAQETEIETEIETEQELEQELEKEPEQELEQEPEQELEQEPEQELEQEPEQELEHEKALDSETQEKTLNEGLYKTKKNFFSRITRSITGKEKIDDLLLDDIEEALITSDIGVETSIKIIQKLEQRVSRDKYINTSELNLFLKEEISTLMKDNTDALTLNNKPYVIMVVGVNGVGKTTTIGKLANKFKKSGKKVMLGAADTFRAAAIDQLVVWSKRVGVDIVKQEMGSDPASVCFDTLQSAKVNNADVVIIDTAGRLHNNINLMNELTKIRNVMNKVIPDAPHEVMLILDASTGQNAIEQALQFTNATSVDSVTLTKLDGTAKGGVVIGISDQFQIPVRYIGVGEGINDLQIFNKKNFINSLFS